VRIVLASHGLGRSGRRERDKYPNARQSRLVGNCETKYRLLPRRECRGSRNAVAKASSRICAAFSGFWDRIDETVVRGFWRLAGITVSSFWDSVVSESISSDDKPRWAVLDLAADRIEEGVMYGRGKG